MVSPTRSPFSHAADKPVPYQGVDIPQPGLKLRDFALGRDLCVYVQGHTPDLGNGYVLLGREGCFERVV